MIRVDHLDHIALTVKDIAVSVEWYCSLLGMEQRYDHWEIPVMVCAGNTCLALFPCDEEAVETDRTGVRHIAFRVDREMFNHARRVLHSRGIDVRSEEHSPAHSLYLRDPDGYQVELVTYDE